MRSGIRARRGPRLIVLLFVASLFSTALLTALDSTTNKASAGQWGGVGATTGSGGASCAGFGASWKLYGNKNLAMPEVISGTTPAWKSFSAAAKEWCKGYGYDDLPSSLIAGCKKSSFIWAYMTTGSGKTGFLSNARSFAGYAGGRNDTAAAVKSGMDSAASGGSAYYKSAKAYIKGRVDVAFKSSNRVTLGCSYESGLDKPKVAIPAKPTFKDLTIRACDNKNYFDGGRYTIPARTGVQYQVNYLKKQANGTYAYSGWVNFTAGTRVFKGPEGKTPRTFSIRAIAKKGFTLKEKATTVWRTEFLNEKLPSCVTPPAPAFAPNTALACDDSRYNTGGGAYTIPTASGVTYYVSNVKTTRGSAIKAGKHTAKPATWVYITAASNGSSAIKPGATVKWQYYFPANREAPQCESTSENWKDYEYRTETAYEAGSREWVERSSVDNSNNTEPLPYFWNTVVENGGPHPGTTKPVAQSNGDYTPLGKLFAKTTSPTPEQLEEAIKATEAAKHHSVDLSAANKKALAEGGVLDVKELTTYAQLVTTKSDVKEERFNVGTVKTTEQDQRRERECSGEVSYVNGVPVKYATSCKAWGPWEDYGDPRVDTYDDGAPTSTTHFYLVDEQFVSTTPAPEVTGYWQILANHCYADGFVGATEGVTGVKVIDNGDDRARWSGSAVTDKMDNALNPTWGSAATHARGTDQDGFYDKLCAFNGVRAGDEADQVRDYTFFRSNELEPLQVNLFKPKAEGVVKASNDPATRTIVTRWSGGTPLPDNISERGSMRSASTDGTQKVFGTKVEPPTLRNFTTGETGSGREWSLLRGEHSAFDFGANWPSDNGKPQVLSVRWEYAPNVANTFPTKNIGFAGAGGAQTYENETVETPIQGLVQSAHSGSTTPAIFEEAAANTGSGEINKLDQNLLYGVNLDGEGRWIESASAFSRFYTTLKFVRATAE